MPMTLPSPRALWYVRSSGLLVTRARMVLRTGPSRYRYWPRHRASLNAINEGLRHCWYDAAERASSTQQMLAAATTDLTLSLRGESLQDGGKRSGR